MADIRIKRTGSWIVELMRPIEHEGRVISKLEISRPPLSATVRWGREEIPSSLALFGEMCGLPEEALLKITEDDMPNVLMAFLHLTPATIKMGMDTGTRPLATPPPVIDTEVPEIPPDPVPAEPEPELPQEPPEQFDPRFPVVTDMPVKKFAHPPQVNLPREDKKEDDGGGLSFDIPEEVMKAIR